MKWHQDESVTAQTQTELQVQALECCRTTVGGFMVSCLLAVTVVFCFTVKWQEMLNLNDEIQLSWTFIRPVALIVDYQSWLSVQEVKMEETGWLLYKRPSRGTILSEGRGFRTFPLKLDQSLVAVFFWKKRHFSSESVGPDVIVRRCDASRSKENKSPSPVPVSRSSDALIDILLWKGTGNSFHSD